MIDHALKIECMRRATGMDAHDLSTAFAMARMSDYQISNKVREVIIRQWLYARRQGEAKSFRAVAKDFHNSKLGRRMTYGEPNRYYSQTAVIPLTTPPRTVFYRDNTLGAGEEDLLREMGLWNDGDEG